MRMRGRVVLVLAAAAAVVVVATAAAALAPAVRLKIGPYPLGVAVGGGSAWVSTHRDTMLYRVDAATNRVVGKVDIGQNACGQVGLGFGRVWIPHCDTATSVIVVDAATQQLVGRVQDAWPLAVAFGFGSAWMPGEPGDQQELLRVDPASLAVVARIPVGQGATAVAGPDAIWVLNGGDGTVSRVDPTTNAVTETLRVGAPGFMAGVFAGGRLWIQNEDTHQVLRLDPRTGKTTVLAVRTVGVADPWLVAGRGRVWVRTSLSEVLGLDARTAKIRTRLKTFAPGGGYLALDARSIWEPASDIDTVLRVKAP